MLPSSSEQQHESFILMVETAVSPKTFLMNYQYTWRHIPEDSNLQTEIKIMIQIC
jgi:hypothetical protein